MRQDRLTERLSRQEDAGRIAPSLFQRRDVSEDAFGTISSGLIATIQYVVGDTIRIYISGRGGGGLNYPTQLLLIPKSKKQTASVVFCFERTSANLLNRRWEAMLKNLCIYAHTLGRTTASRSRASEKTLYDPLFLVLPQRYVPRRFRRNIR